MEEVAASSALAGRQAVTHHQMEASLAEQAQQLHERLLNAKGSANIVFAQVEAEAECRESRSRNETNARDDEIARLKSDMQEMMRIQQQRMELLKINNETLRRRLAEAEARNLSPSAPPGASHDPELPPGLATHIIATPPEKPDASKEMRLYIYIYIYIHTYVYVYVYVYIYLQAEFTVLESRARSSPAPLSRPRMVSRVAVQEFKLSYYNQEALSFIILFV